VSPRRFALGEDNARPRPVKAGHFTIRWRQDYGGAARRPRGRRWQRGSRSV